MEKQQTAFQIEKEDNVATALEELEPGAVALHGDFLVPVVDAAEKIPIGHKLAVKDIEKDAMIVKYGVAYWACYEGYFPRFLGPSALHEKQL